MIDRVWILGDAVVDLVPENSNNYLKCPGGALATIAKGAITALPNVDKLTAFLQMQT